MKVPGFATVLTICGSAILVTLGTWQLQRLQWKQDIIAKLNAGYDAPTALTSEQMAAWSMEENPVGYGTATGRPLRESAVLLGPRILDGRSGYHLLLPIEMDGGGRVLIVNAGWVDPLWADNTEDRLASLPAGNINVRGAVHKPDWSSFASKNSPSNDLWFRADIAEIAAAKDLMSPYAFILYADKTNPALEGITPQQERWLPRNKHLQYALFWYAMAAALMTVYGFYLRGYQRKT